MTVRNGFFKAMAQGPGAVRGQGPGQGPGRGIGKDLPVRGLPSEQVLTRERAKLKKPDMYRVVIINDDYTPMEFVVWVLQIVFHKPTSEATRLMLEVHKTGRGVCGVFTHDVARTKAIQVENIAKRHEHPLQARLEVVGAA